MQAFNLVLLGVKQVAGLSFLHVEAAQLLLELFFGGIVLVLHGQDVFVDGDLVL